MNKNGCYIDLHAHLDGSVTVDIAKKLAALQNIALPADNDKELLTLLSVPDSCESLNDFLQCFDLPGRLMQTPEGLQNAVTLVLENMALDGVIYAELRFAPQFHTLGGMTQEQAVQAAVAGLKNAPIPGNLILCCMRGEGNEKANEETLALAKKYLVRDHGVTAMDLAGAEALFPTVNYLDLFEEAKAAGIEYGDLCELIITQSQKLFHCRSNIFCLCHRLTFIRIDQLCLSFPKSLSGASFFRSHIFRTPAHVIGFSLIGKNKLYKSLCEIFCILTPEHG